ncbi:MoxR family ATPase [Komagataeibacter rhaeticus]|uniref:MoxR family ATPase n=1 Tax=Komagataeibacter rhaeticus TaxID=215221 RepID=A0A858JHA3_9PROT|nr:MoxR family ATPase [Komagataeibacter rhaeticus]ATU71952.1 MoxR family ATPase [Komagataeibacter xylinus]KDU95757.1 ATPase AAA [Komagataeibacter rhaeticus AF1]MBL7239997.1 MoxR family ATPase [Komagataeibacter rhaeticus]PYD54625.1 MoxR family ATPase [Komagataeibacter rhaeticus]QIP35926.1 MoxR family ATPase [Komagataeibacter rhaeticus]
MMTMDDTSPLHAAPQAGMTSPTGPTGEQIAARAEAMGGRLRDVRTEIGRVILGQDRVVDLALTTILAGGHALLVGAPGLGKTLLVTTLGHVLGMDARRVQFTPDLMPSDILGSEILDEDDSGRRSFRFVAGPVFCQMLMADEINRASPRTQSALLQAMQEREVAIAGSTHLLPRPFHVLATQNPIEQEGTYPLPEAQLDRFMMQVVLDFPTADAERAMLLATTGTTTATASPVMTAADVMQAQALVRALPVGEQVVDAIVRLVRAARPETTDDPTIREAVAWGPGPRAAQAFMLATRARALLGGRLSPDIEDVRALAHPILAHRMALSFTARAENMRLPALIDTLVGRIG